MLGLALGCGATVSVAAAAQEAGDELVPLIVNLLSDKDKDVRALGFEQVRTEAKGAVATKQFAAQLAKLPPDAQVGLLSALADRGDSAARTAIVDLLAASREEPVRVAAIAALGFLGEGADLPALLKLLTGGSTAEQAAARASLVRLPGSSVPGMLAAELKTAKPTLRVTLIGILAARRALETIPQLLAITRDSDPAVRTASMAALGQLAGPEQVPGLLQGVLGAEKGREREAAERAVALVCARIPEAGQQAQPVLAALSKLPKADQTALLPTLGRVGGPAALKTVEAAIAETDSGRHEAGLRALCNWPDASVAARLIELLQTDAHPEHRTAALRAVIRVAPLADGRSDADRLALVQKTMGLCQRASERNLVLQRAAAIRTLDSLHFVLPYLDQPAYAQQACESVVELAHHRELRDAHKAEFERALDQVLRVSQDATVKDRANRYKKGQTWVRPATPDR
jgi:HEAT repeat protein